jgi:AraC-like DNA-binding protein
MIFFKLKKGVWNRKSTISIVDDQNKLLFKWTLFLFVIGLFASIRLLASLFYDLSTSKSNFGQNFLWVSSILYISLYIKILVSPDILFGYNAYYKKMNDPKLKKFVLVDLWVFKESNKINNIQDEQLRTKVLLNLDESLIAIEDLVLNKKWFRNLDSKHNMMATELKIPKSHINYIFKYHSKVSFVEFRKIIRVYDSIQLIEEDFLKSNTLESLASKAGFSSYNPFFTAFKEVTAITPQAYNKRVQSLKKYN